VKITGKTPIVPVPAGGVADAVILETGIATPSKSEAETKLKKLENKLESFN